jgi:hypothetical protein
MKPLVPVAFKTCPRLLIQLFFGGYQPKSTVTFCATMTELNANGTIDLMEGMEMDRKSVNAAQSKTNVKRTT